MKISISCPGIVLQNATILDTDELAGLTLEGSLLSFDIQGESLNERLKHLTDMEAHVGGRIADADEAELIYALGHLKASIAGMRPVVLRESSYSSRASVSEDAAVDSDVSQLHVQQHTSTDESSEQHGVAPLNEEIEIEQAEQEKSGFTGFFGQRARVDGR